MGGKEEGEEEEEDDEGEWRGGKREEGEDIICKTSAVREALLSPARPCLALVSPAKPCYALCRALLSPAR